MRNYKDLLVWQKAHRFALAVYQFTGNFPRRETFGLALQARRSAVSIAANIAEGFGRRTKPEKARFLNIAEGSLDARGMPLLPDSGAGSRLRRYR